MLKNVESKVLTATVGSGAGVALSAFVLWILGVTAWHASTDAGAAATAMAAVPAPVAGIVALILTVAGTFVAGYSGEHTHRPDLYNLPTEDAEPVPPGPDAAPAVDVAPAPDVAPVPDAAPVAEPDVAPAPDVAPDIAADGPAAVPYGVPTP